MTQESQVQTNPLKSLPKVTLVLAKIAEVLHWCMAGVMLIGAIAAGCSASFREWISDNLLSGERTLSCYGFETTVANASGDVQLGGVIVFALGSVVILSLMAMVFRNVYLILKTAQGKTWFSKGNTPFQQNIVRMSREIGIFFIIITLASLISTTVVSATGNEIASGFNYLSGFVGLVFLCISQFFNYGTSLEKEVDGLV